MSPKRPTAVLIAAILLLAFGGLNLFCGASAMLIQAMDMSPEKLQARAGADRPQDKLRIKLDQQMEERLPSYKSKGEFYAGFGVMLSLMMVVSGIGLLRMAAWGWWLAVAYACLSLLSQCLNLGYEELVVRPVHRAIVAELPTATEEDRAAIAMFDAVAVISPVIVVLFLALPLLVLLLLVLPATRSAFSRQPFSDRDRGYSSG